MPTLTFRNALLAAIAAAGFAASACSGGAPADLEGGGSAPTGRAAAPASKAGDGATPPPALQGTGGATGARIDPDARTDFSAPFDLLNPAGEKRVDAAEYRKLIGRDVIVPVYEPRYVTPDEANLLAEELVMGVEINGESRAFPIGFIRSREIVNDIIGGVPVLITW